MVCETTDDEEEGESDSESVLVLVIPDDHEYNSVPRMVPQTVVPVMQYTLAPANDQYRVVLPSTTLNKVIKGVALAA